jgi:hypothetical protein
MIFISAWEAYTNGIGAALAQAEPDEEVWEGDDGSVIIGDFNPEDVTCEYAVHGTVAEYLADRANDDG